jgi:hypothetical protein
MGLKQIGCGVDSFGSELEQLAGYCVHGNETSDSTKFLDDLSDYKLLEKDSALCT